MLAFHVSSPVGSSKWGFLLLTVTQRRQPDDLSRDLHQSSDEASKVCNLISNAAPVRVNSIEMLVFVRGGGGWGVEPVAAAH